MPDDDPIEDLQRAGATAGAAGARAVEAALRSRQQQQPVQDPQAEAERQRRRDKSIRGYEPSGYGRQVGGYAEDNHSQEFVTEQSRQPVTLDGPDTWGSKDDAVTAAQQWTLEKAGMEMPGTKGEASKLIRDMYDSPEARAGRHDAMEAAGVALEPRQAAMTADKMNATDPANAARSGSMQKTQRARTGRQPQRERSR